jgi:ABC-type Zn2+ transport system substrate-binding protein/surface adhesin
MTRAALLNGFRILIALAVMLSALPFLRAASSVHEVGLAQIMDSLAFADHSDEIGHAHSHDDDMDPPDHRHGHGLEHKDHSHVTLGLTALPASLKAPDGKFLRVWEQGRPPSHLTFRLDRPPCPLSVA